MHVVIVVDHPTAKLSTSNHLSIWLFIEELAIALFIFFLVFAFALGTVWRSLPALDRLSEVSKFSLLILVWAGGCTRW
jgi:hypothetical protein